jgi:hypothetical protein
MSTKYLFLFLSLIISVTSMAGDRKGNGADLVVCSDKVTLLDFYENDLEEMKWNLTEQDLVIHLISKMDNISPGRFNSYIEQVKNFYNDTKFVTESELGPIADSGNIKKPIPASCKLVQGVIQKLIVFGNEKRFLINKVYWDKLNVVNKAGLIFHELVYKELQSINSSKIRTFNSWVFSTAESSIDPATFYKNFKDADFKWINLYGYPMDAQKLILDDSPIRSRYTFPDKAFIIFDQTVMSKSHMVDSYTNGRPKVIQYKGQVSLETSAYKLTICSSEHGENCKLNLASDGSITLMNNADVVDKTTGESYSNKTIKFGKNGAVEEVL